MKLALKSVAILLVFISLGIQVYILLILFFELSVLGHTGVVTAFGYSASLVFSVPTYFAAMTLVYCAKIGLRMRWIHAFYFGSHVTILACMFTLPGNFV
jgi:phosphoglycerol transferase MdoB-like AlkP superfamily enzyme